MNRLLLERQGIYAVPEALLNTMIDVERIVPKGIVCLYNAWAYHQLSTTVPPAFCIAIANKRKVEIPETLPIELYYWKKENLEFGIMEAEISGFHVRITDLERSVCDAVKYRNKLGLDVCAEVIRSYLRKPNRNLSRLQDYAKRLRVFNTLKNYLEIAIEEDGKEIRRSEGPASCKLPFRCQKFHAWNDGHHSEYRIVF